MERYNLEEAQEEAAAIQQKIESGRVSWHADAERIIEASKPVTKVMLETKIIDLAPIERSRNEPVRYREQLAALVERPLLSACEELYDKNIRTLSTSANAKDVASLEDEQGQSHFSKGAYINIDFDALSAKNQETGKLLGEVSFSDDRNMLKISYPLTRDSTFEDVQTWALNIAHRFVKQQYRVTAYTLEEMRGMYGYAENDESVTPEDFEYYFWSPEYKLFFLSQEQFEKAVEPVDEDE